MLTITENTMTTPELLDLLGHSREDIEAMAGVPFEDVQTLTTSGGEWRRSADDEWTFWISSETNE